MYVFVAVLLGSLLIVLPADAQTKWTLWRVTDTWPYPSDGGEMPQRLEIPMEQDLDRGACELVKQSHVQSLRGGPFRPAMMADGGVYIIEGSLFKDNGKAITERYLCLAVGKTPAQASPPRPAMKLGTKWGGRPGGHSQDLPMTDEQREQLRETNRKRPYCKWVLSSDNKWVSECVDAPVE